MTKIGAWAPGNYECECQSCGTRFVGDKRAMECLVCASASVVRARDGYQKHLRACEQIAGKALGYPAFKDDQVNFPGATEADGVCIGEHVGETIVEELAAKLEEAQSTIVDREARLLILEAALLDRIGCFPLDRTNDSDRLWNDAAVLARQVSGDDFKAREKRLADVRQAFALLEMCAVYPGDPGGGMQRDACALLGIPYREAVVTVTFGESAS